MLDTLFLQILNMSFTASAVIIFVIIARFFLKKVPKIFSYALWSVVFFRLVCPFSFESTISLLPTKTNPIPSDIMYAHMPQINTGIAAINDSVNAILPAATPNFSMNPMQGWVFIGSVLWLVGIALMLIYSVVSLIKLHRKLKDAVHESDNIYISASLVSPFVVGLFRPKIYLPSNLTDCEKRYILLHEQTHIKRFDHVAKILSFLILCVYWFNPFVWAAFFLSSRDMELVCDEAVIKRLGNEIKKDYSSSLLALATGRRIVGGTPLAFGEGDTKSRIKNVLSYKKPAFWVIAVSIIAVVAVGIGLAANPKDDTSDMFADSADDVLDRYTLALMASDITGMRYLMPMVNPPAQEVIDTWKQIKIENVEVLSEDVRENKAAFKISVTVKEAPEGVGMWTPGAAIHYMYAEKCSRGWYVESDGASGRSQSDLEAWWKQPNLIDGVAQLSAENLWSARTAHVGNNSAVGKLLDMLPLPQGLRHNHFRLLTSGDERGIEWVLDETENAAYSANELNRPALLLFALIDNLKDFYVTSKDAFGGGIELHYDRAWADETVGCDIRDYAESADTLQTLIDNDSVVWQWARRPMLMVDGHLYLDTGQEVREEIKDSAILGKITSSVKASEKASKNGQCNFDSGVGAKYALCDGGIAVFLNNRWFLFERETAEEDAESSVIATITELENGENRAQVIIEDKADISRLNSLLHKGKPTAKKSVQDVPNEKSYIKISLEPSNGMPDSYIYEKGGKYYVERPYSGIWEIGYDTLEEIVEMFTSGAHLSEPLLALPEEYPPSLAAASGDYVDVHGSISNAEAMYSFIKAVSKNEKACIRTTAYTIEGDAIITDFNFDGSGHSVSKDARRDKFGEQTITNYSFSNLVQFTPDTLPAVRCYYVTDLTEITKEDYANGVDGILLASLPME